jgi:hypothetical protein
MAWLALRCVDVPLQDERPDTVLTPDQAITLQRCQRLLRRSHGDPVPLNQGGGRRDLVAGLQPAGRDICRDPVADLFPLRERRVEFFHVVNAR